MKKIILFAILSLIALPVLAYTRSPSGLEITSPVSFTFLASDYKQGPWLSNAAGRIIVDRTGEGDYTFGTCKLVSENPTGFTDIIDLALGDYKNVMIKVWSYSPEENPLAYDCIGDSASDNLEGTGADVIFTIIETPAGGVPSLFSVPMASSSDMVASVGTLFTDLWVIIALVIGIPLAFYIIQRVSALPPKAGKRE
jgi:hypothetical protein